MSDAPWNVLPHDPLETLDDGLWRVEGSLPHGPLRRVMAVARMEDGQLLIHSAIAVDEPTLEQLLEHGEPGVLVVPSALHRLDAPAWKARFPQLRVLCPEGARTAVEKKVPVDGGYRDFAGDARVSLELLDGVGQAEGVLTVRSPGGTSLVFNDAVFNMPHPSGLHGLIVHYVTASSGGPKVSRLFRMVGVKDKAALAAHLRRLADTPDLRRVLVAHHQTIDDAPADVLRSVADAL